MSFFNEAVQIAAARELDLGIKPTDHTSAACPYGALEMNARALACPYGAIEMNRRALTTTI